MNHPGRALMLVRRTMHYLLLCLSSLAAAAFVAAFPATAASLPAASTFVRCYADGNNTFDATECTQGGSPGIPSSAFAIAKMSPSPVVSVEVIAPPAAVIGAGADASATYGFGVTGGSEGDTVPLLIDFGLGAFSTAQSLALARIIVRTSGVLFAVEELVCDPETCETTEFADTLSVPARSGSTLDSVSLYVMAQAPPTGTSQTARAYVDPYIYVDPTFPNASLYSIVVSPGVGNVLLSPVPEPTPAILWLAGSVLIGLRLMRQTKSSALRCRAAPA